MYHSSAEVNLHNPKLKYFSSIFFRNFKSSSVLLLS